MRSSDILNFVLAGGFLLIVGAIWYVAYDVVKTLRAIRLLVVHIESITQDMEAIKDQMKNSVVGKIAHISQFFLRRKEVSV